MNIEASSVRVSQVHAYQMDKFKKSLVSYKPDAFRAAIDTIIASKRKAENDANVAEAVAKAKAEPRGLLRGIFM